MTEVKRGPGRPPKVRPEAETTEDFALASYRLHAPAPKIEEVAAERKVEVELLRKYAPGGQKQEIQNMVYPGTVIELPVAEATRTLKLGIARATDRTFG